MGCRSVYIAPEIHHKGREIDVKPIYDLQNLLQNQFKFRINFFECVLLQSLLYR